MMTSEIPSITLREFFLWLFRRRRHFRVIGNSMQPLLKPGDIVLVDPNAYDLRSPTKGDIVVAWHPYWTDLRMIKRVRVFHPDGSVALAGDNPEESTDFDTIALDKIFGQVTSKIG